MDKVLHCNYREEGCCVLKQRETCDPENCNVTFEEISTKFYNDLLSKQQRLTTEMEQILQDNLWDLYQS